MATRKKRAVPKGFATWSAYMASIRPSVRRRKSTSSAKDSAMPAKSRRRAAVRRVASKARSVASRASGAVSRSGVVPFATAAAMDAGGVLAGKVLVRAIRARTPIAAGTPLAALFEIATGVALGMLIGKKSKAWGQRIAIGAMLGPMETLVKRFNVPVVAEALGDDGFVYTDLADAELVEAYGPGEEYTASPISGYVSNGMGDYVGLSAIDQPQAYEFGGYVGNAAMQMAQ